MKYLFYQLEVAVILIVFYLIYRFIISSSTLFFQKRVYLLSSVLLSFIMIFLNIHINQPLNINYSYLLNEVVVPICQRMRMDFPSDPIL
jgi:chromate transport protein ChrA